MKTMKNPLVPCWGVMRKITFAEQTYAWNYHRRQKKLAEILSLYKAATGKDFVAVEENPE